LPNFIRKKIPIRFETPKALSTLSQKSAIVRQSHFSATVWTGLKALFEERRSDIEAAIRQGSRIFATNL